MRGTPTIGIITAAAFEAEALLGEMKGKRKHGPFTTGTIAGRRIVHVAPGIGAANAARGATLLLERRRPGAVILAGIGGAYPGAGVAVGGLVAAEKEIYADLGVLTKDGLLPVSATGIELMRKGKRKYFNEFPLDRRLLKQAAKHIGDLKAGVFLTVSQVTGTAERARRLRERYGALCENMEGAAVAQTCAAYGVPLLEIRGISNMVEDRDPSRWKKTLAAENCQRAVIELIKLDA